MDERTSGGHMDELDTQSTDAPELPYEAPRVEELGSLAELTLGFSGPNSDGMATTGGPSM